MTSNRESEREERIGSQNRKPSESDDLTEEASMRHKRLYLEQQVSPRSNPTPLGLAPPTRSPGQNVSQSDDIINSIGTICVRDHAHTVAVELQQSLYQVQYLTVARGFSHTLDFPYFAQ
jgi:hypothetical protein